MKGDVSSTEGEVAADDRVTNISIISIITMVMFVIVFPTLKTFIITICNLLFPPELNFCKILQDQNELKRKNAKLTDYYENLRSNVFSIFGTQNYADSYLGLYLISNYSGWHEDGNMDLPIIRDDISRLKTTHPRSRGVRGSPWKGETNKTKICQIIRCRLARRPIFLQLFLYGHPSVGHLLCQHWKH